MVLSPELVRAMKKAKEKVVEQELGSAREWEPANWGSVEEPGKRLD